MLGAPSLKGRSDEIERQSALRELENFLACNNCHVERSRYITECGECFCDNCRLANYHNCHKPCREESLLCTSVQGKRLLEEISHKLGYLRVLFPLEKVKLVIEDDNFGTEETVLVVEAGPVALMVLYVS